MWKVNGLQKSFASDPNILDWTVLLIKKKVTITSASKSNRFLETELN